MKLLIINPGSTSTKISVYENESVLLEESVFHDAPELLRFDHVNKQLPFRLKVTEEVLKSHGLSFADIDVFVGRGGSAVPVKSGVMRINELLYEDTKQGKGGSEHPAKLGVLLAYELAQAFGKQAYTLDPTNVDELCPPARLTGIKGLYRNAQAHVLNQKAAARKHCEAQGLNYEEADLIVAHIDGGITVHAHHNGRMIDGNVGSGGDGAFTPTRIGSVPVLKLLDYIEEHGIKEVRDMTSRSGGLVSFFGTSDFRKVFDLVEKNDPKALLVYEAMVYQINKQIGAMAAVLKGHVDAIILTGGLVSYPDLCQRIRESCGFIADIHVYPGEFEQEALAHEVYRALQGKRPFFEYDGIPPFSGFPFIDGE